LHFENKECKIGRNLVGLEIDGCKEKIEGYFNYFFSTLAMR